MILQQRLVQPRLQLARKEAEYQIHSTPYELHRPHAQPRRPPRLPSEVAIQPHIVSERQRGVVDLEEVRDEIALAVDHGRDFFQQEGEGLGCAQVAVGGFLFVAMAGFER